MVRVNPVVTTDTPLQPISLPPLPMTNELPTYEQVTQAALVAAPAPEAAPAPDADPAWLKLWQRWFTTGISLLVLLTFVGALAYAAHRLDNKSATTYQRERECVGRVTTEGPQVLCCPAMEVCCQPTRLFNLTGKWAPVKAYQCRTEGGCSRLRPVPLHDCGSVRGGWVFLVALMCFCTCIGMCLFCAACEDSSRTEGWARRAYIRGNP